MALTAGWPRKGPLPRKEPSPPSMAAWALFGPAHGKQISYAHPRQALCEGCCPGPVTYPVRTTTKSMTFQPLRR